MSLRKYVILSGNHFDAKTNILYKTGDIVVSATALDKAFVNKFRDEGAATVTEAKKTAAAGEKVVVPGSPAPAPEAPAVFASELGDDVTGDFKDVPAGHRVVTKGGGKFFVVTEATPNEAAHSGGAITAKQVASFLASIE